MTVDWKLLSLAMIVSVVIIWVCALVVSVFFIQPLLDMWRCLPQILANMSENHSTTFAVSRFPSIPLWILLIISLLLWCVLTVSFYIIMNYLKKMKKKKVPPIEE
ncbi:MAG TPA: hypothetical protein VN365_05795 [Candidatus Thermoplasmatota archaeon]|nr:hypothetical protein [Candidatus Thermoplasmatota archaeon]